MSDIVRVPFHGDDILCVRVDGKPHVILKPVLDALGVDYWTQVRKLRGKTWACTSTRLVQLPDQDQRREFVTVDIRTFLMMLATIDERRVAPDAKARLQEYQSEVADALEDYFTKGGAVNRRATAEQLTALVDLSTKRIGMLKAADGLVDPAWLEAKARTELARGIGEEPEIDPANRPLTVGEYLVDKDLSAAQLRSISTQMGKLLKKAYREQYRTDPKPVPRFIDGAIRPVAGYTEAHRPLFDAAWAATSKMRSVS